MTSKRRQHDHSPPPAGTLAGAHGDRRHRGPHGRARRLLGQRQHTGTRRVDRPRRSRRRLDADPVDARAAREAGEPARRRVQRQPREPGRAHRRAQRRLRRQGRRRRRLRRTPRPVRGRHRLRAQLGRAGAVPGHLGADRGPPVQGRDQPGPPVGRHRRRQGARASVRARPLDAVLEQGPLHRGRARPREGARPTSRSSPRTRRRSRRSARTASTAPRPASTAAAASSSPGSRACGPTAKRC